MILLEFDLSGAEWVIVAYASGDANMLEVVNSGKSPHVVTGGFISSVSEELVLAEHKIVGNHTDQDTIAKLREQLPELLELQEKDAIWLPRTMSIRQCGKKSNHGLNYGMRYRRFALEYEVPEADAQVIVDGYNEVAYPALKDWHTSIREQLRTNNRTLINCFNRKVRLLGEWGPDLFMAAYSFTAQSTVADIINGAMCEIYEDIGPLFIPMELSAQVHDSLMLQYPEPLFGNNIDWNDLAAFCLRVKDYMDPELEYGGRKFHLRCDLKMGVSWGNMKEISTDGGLEALAHDLQAMHAAVVSEGNSPPEPLEVSLEEVAVS